MGPNGAGKSTLLDLMAFLILGDTGRLPRKFFSSSRDLKVYREFALPFSMKVYLNGDEIELKIDARETRTLPRTRKNVHLPAEPALLRSLLKINEEERKDLYETIEAEEEASRRNDLLRELIKALSPSLGKIRAYLSTIEKLTNAIYGTRSKKGLKKQLEELLNESEDIENTLEEILTEERKLTDLKSFRKKEAEERSFIEKQIQNLEQILKALKIENVKRARIEMESLVSKLKSSEELSKEDIAKLKKEKEDLETLINKLSAGKAYIESFKEAQMEEEARSRKIKTLLGLTGLALIAASLLSTFFTLFPTYVNALALLISLIIITFSMLYSGKRKVSGRKSKLLSILDELKRGNIIQKPEFPATQYENLERIFTIITQKDWEFNRKKEEILEKLKKYETKLAKRREELEKHLSKVLDFIYKSSMLESNRELADIFDQTKSILSKIREDLLRDEFKEASQEAERALELLKILQARYPDLQNIKAGNFKISELNQKIAHLRSRLTPLNEKITRLEKEIGEVEGKLKEKYKILQEKTRELSRRIEIEKRALVYFDAELPTEVTPSHESIKELREKLKESIQTIESKGKNLERLKNLLTKADEKARENVASIITSPEVESLFREFYPSFQGFEVEESVEGTSRRKKIRLKVKKGNSVVTAGHMSKGERDHLSLITRLSTAMKLLQGNSQETSWEVFPVFLDEPFYSSDPDRKSKVWETILKLSNPPGNSPRFQIFVTALEVPENIKKKIKEVDGKIIEITPAQG